MNEKNKMLSGLSYNSRDPELMEIYQKARILNAQFNSFALPNDEKAIQILTKLLKKLGDNSFIENPFYVDFGQFISIGKQCFIGRNCSFIDNNYIEIGDQVLIGPGVQIFTSYHPIKTTERINKDGSYTTMSNPVKIHSNSWIGGSSIILPGVEIGEGSIIGAGSVVTKSIQAGVIAYGNPCKEIKKIN